MNEEAPILRAIAASETKLMAALESSVQRLQTDLANMRSDQTEFALSQSEKNATFASRERVHELSNEMQLRAIKIAKIEGKVDGLGERQDRTDKRVEEIDERIDGGVTRSREWSLARLGFAAIVVAAIASPIIAAFLAHL